MKLPLLFVDGTLRVSSKNEIDRLSPGVLKARGLFETMRACGGSIFALDDHMRRLALGLKKTGIALPYSTEQLRKYLYLSLHSNRLSQARIRLTIWKTNAGARIVIAVLPFLPLTVNRYRKGFHATVLFKRCPRGFQMGRVKSLHYAFFKEALASARKKGYDEAILINERGFLMEGSRTNIFMVRDKKLYTPSLACGCLKGITCQKVLKIVKDVGLSSSARKISPEELFRADEVFVTNSLLGIMPVTRVDGQKIGSGRAGKITMSLLKQYQQLLLPPRRKPVPSSTAL